MAADPTPLDVIVLGAGVAGLAAARELARSGRRVAIVEGRDRVGGRIATLQVNLADEARPFPVELGAEFVHGLPAATWSLVGEASLAAFELDGKPFCFDDGLLRECPQQTQGASAALDQMMTWLDQQPPGTDPTFADYLQIAGLSGVDAERAATYVEGFNAADRNVIGVAALAQQQKAEDAIQGDRIFHIVDGYEAIPKFLAKQFEESGGRVILSHSIDSVHWRRGAVTVGGSTGSGAAFEFMARRALITLPLGVLQAGTVTFEPTPAEPLRQIKRMAMGHVRRITLVFKTKFWDFPLPGATHSPAPGLGDLSFLFAFGQNLPTWWTPMPDAAPVITAWVAGPRADAFERRVRTEGQSAAILNECLSTLSILFSLPRGAVEAQLQSWHTHDWQADPFASGAYSYAPAGARDASEKLTRPVEGTLYFAGEHTDTEGHWGTVHGALASGLRAARQIIECG